MRNFPVRFWLLFGLLVLLVIGVATLKHPGGQHGSAAAAVHQAPSLSQQLGKLHAATEKDNPYGLPYRNTASGYGTGMIRADAVYFPAEKGRYVVCLSYDMTYEDATMSCDWAGYHAKYGPGDPFDQR